MAAKRATPPCLLAVCTDERRHGPGRSDAPYRPTGPEDSQGQGGGTRGALHRRVPDDCSSSRAGALRLLRGAQRGVVELAVGAAGAAGAGSAAHSGAPGRYLPLCADSRCSCAADGRTAGGRPPFFSIRCVLLPSRLSTCPRSSSRTSLRDACVASRSWWNSWWKYQQSFLRDAFLRGLWSRSLIFLEEVSKVYAQFRVQQRLRHPQFLTLQLAGSTLRVRRFKGGEGGREVSHPIKVRRSPGTRVRECPGSRAHPR